MIGLAPGQSYDIADKTPYQPFEGMTVEEALKPLGAGKFHHVPLTPSMIQAALDRAGA